MNAFSRHWSQLKPAEHGSWSLLLSPFLIGAGLAAVAGRSSGGALPALALFALLALAVFFARQPVGTLARILRGRARRRGTALAALWAAGLALVAALCGGGLLALGRTALLPLAIPALTALAASLLIAARFGPRGLALEMVGVLGLALAAPGAYAALTAALDSLALAAWCLGAAHGLIGVLYVRLRVATRHDRVSRGVRVAAAASHLLVLGAVAAAGALGALPWPVALPFGLLMARAWWAAWCMPPLGNVRRFGFTEMGISLAFAGSVVLAYAVSR